MAREIVPVEPDPILAYDPESFVFLGPRWSYSDIAIHAVCDTLPPPKRFRHRNEPRFHGVDTFEEVADEVRTNDGAMGIVPIETSSRVVTGVADEILTGDFLVLGSFGLKVELMVGGLADDIGEVKTIHAMNPARDQAVEFLRGYNVEWAKSTAEAAERVIGLDPTHAALCSRSAIAGYGLNPLKENVEDLKEKNDTRFVAIHNRNGESYQPDVSRLRGRRLRRGRLRGETEVRAAAIIAPTKTEANYGFLDIAEHLKDRYDLRVLELMRRHQPLGNGSGGDEKLLVEIIGKPRKLWKVLKDERRYNNRMGLDLLGMYSVGRTYTED